MLETYTGTFTGRYDSQGNPLNCGDRVRFHEGQESYRVTSYEDGWGRDHPLCRHDQYTVPAQSKDNDGVILYSEKYCGYVIRWDNQAYGSRGGDEMAPRRGEDELRCILMACGREGSSLSILSPG